MGDLRRRKRQVRPFDQRSDGSGRVAQGLPDGGLPQADAFPHRLANSRHPDRQARRARSRPLLREAAQLGFPLEYLDVGGGLGVDYDGSRSAYDSSTNYTLGEYARDVVYNVADVCNEEKVPHPTLISESGRAIVAHHSVLIVDIFGVIEKTKAKPFALPEGVKPPKPVADLLELRATLNRKNRREHFHDAVQIRDDAQARFDLGLLDLATKAQVETLFWEIAETVVRLFADRKRRPTKSTTSRIPSATSSSATFPSSSRCSITGPSANSSPSRRSTGSTRPRNTMRRSSTSPATRTARSASSSTATAKSAAPFRSIP